MFYLPELQKFGKKHQSVIYRIALTVSLITFLAILTQAGLRASQYFSTNSDAILATQQFSHGLNGNTVALPASHSNLLMTPLLYIQGHFRYGYKSFALANIVLIFLTMGGWAILLIKIFGNKYAIPIFWLLSSLIFISLTFNFDIGNTTFRNISYPISLWFIITISEVISGAKRTRLFLGSTIASSLLFTLVLAGDSFFNYSVVLPLLLAIGVYCFYKLYLNKAIVGALLIIVGTVVLANIIKCILGFLDVIYFDTTFLPKPTIISWDLLGPSLGIALSQMFDIQGGMIFGKAASLSNAGYFINFLVFFMGLTGLVDILRTNLGRLRGKSKGIMRHNNFVLVVSVISFFIVLVEYIFSGYVAARLSSGEIADWMNTRYITFLPLILTIGTVWLLKTYFREIRYIALLCLILALGIFISHGAVSTAFATEQSTKPVPKQHDIDYLISTLESNGVHNIVTDFWYGPPIRFWSGDKIQYAPQIGCNKPLYFDSRKDWYKPSNGKTALIIDRGGLNYGYWGCSDEDLVDIYGQPSKKLVASGVRTQDIVEVWFYNYDVREKILPFPTDK